MAQSAPAATGGVSVPAAAPPKKLHGRAFYESIGSPKLILAPMVDQSEFAWRMLSRSFLKPSDRRSLLAYTPMLHARLFAETQSFRDHHFQPLRSGLPSVLPVPYPGSQEALHLDGNPSIDRPLTVQFCANDPAALLAAARYVAPFCDAVDLNLGCPQGIARKGHYGAFLQEDWDLVCRLIRTLHENLDVPVTAKIRVLETKGKTLDYARRIVEAGASILTVHGRRREQKGHETGLADWNIIRYLRQELPHEVVMFANGNVLRHEDIERCLMATGVDGVMSAEGNLSDPTIFAEAPEKGKEEREYWSGRNGRGGYRLDAIFRRYLDIIYKYVLEKEPPVRKPLFLPSDPVEVETQPVVEKEVVMVTVPTGGPLQSPEQATEDHPRKRQRRGQKDEMSSNPNMTAMQAHLFHLLRPLISVHTNVRDALAKCRSGKIEPFEHVLELTEEAVKKGLLEYEANPEKFEDTQPAEASVASGAGAGTVEEVDITDHESSLVAVRICKRPFWVAQPYVRPLPKEALAKGALNLSKKELKKLEEQKQAIKHMEIAASTRTAATTGLEGSGGLDSRREQVDAADGMKRDEIPKEAMVAG